MARLPAIAEPPYRTRLGRRNVQRAVRDAFVEDRKRQLDELVLEHLPLVRTCAARVQLQLPSSISLDDIVHAGILGLLDAADKHLAHPTAAAFAPYAAQHIRRSVRDFLRETGSPHLSMPQLDGFDEADGTRLLESLDEALLDRLPRTERRVLRLYYSDQLTMKEIGELLGIDVDRVAELHRSALERLAAIREPGGPEVCNR